MEAGVFTMNNDFIDMKEIAAMLSIKPKSVYYITQSDTSFPRPLVISPRIKRWRKQEVVNWIESRLDQK